MLLPFTYIGLPIRANPRKEAMWVSILNRIKSKLSRWKHKNLYMMGCISLINSVLNYIPIFYLSFFRISALVANKIIGFQRRFLQGGNEDRRKIAWVSWDQICRPKECGGLGIKNIRRFNEALLGKWRWNLFHEENALRKEILVSKYNGWSGLVSEVESERDFSIWWRDLRLVCGSRSEVTWFDDNVE